MMSLGQKGTEMEVQGCFFFFSLGRGETELVSNGLDSHTMDYRVYCDMDCINDDHLGNGFVEDGQKKK